MNDSEENKLFVGGICRNTSVDTLKQYFSKYGTVVGCVIAKHRNTGSPRGFAFVSFAAADSSSVHNALQDTHNILGRMVEVKRAIPRSEQNQNQQQSRGLSRSNGRSNGQFRTKKIFVGGLSASLTDEDFKNYFERFGRITDVVVMHDNVTHRPRGFGFITFDSEDAVEDVMRNSFHELSGKRVEVKRAVPKEGNNTSSNDYNVRVGSGRGSNSNSNQHGNYMPYSPRYAFFPGYGGFSGYGGVEGYPYGPGVYAGSYSTGGYGGFCYGATPVAPRSPWNGHGVSGSPLPYGSAATAYTPPYLNGGVGVMNVAANGSNGIVGTGLSGNSSGGDDVQVV